MKFETAADAFNFIFSTLQFKGHSYLFIKEVSQKGKYQIYHSLVGIRKFSSAFVFCFTIFFVLQ